jgi:hypothetical protein
MTKIMQCTCTHDSQDKLHGANNRVFNMTEKGKVADMRVWRCTVCSKEVTSGRR